MRIVIDATSPWALRTVGGLPMFIRVLREASRLGAEQAEVVAADFVTEAKAALSFRSVDMSVVVTERASDGSERLDGAALYSPGLKSIEIPIRDEASLRAAQAQLWARIRKPMAADGVVAYYVARPLVTPITRLLLPTRVRPNQVSIATLVTGVAGGCALAAGLFVPGFLLFFIGSLIDCIDGDIARLRLEGSRTGEWLDTLGDDGSTLAVTIGVTLGLGRSFDWALPLGLVAAAAFIVSSLLIYHRLATTPGPIDTARYEWWFLSAAPVRGGGEGVLGKLQYLMRRDFQTAAMFVFACVGMVWLCYTWLVLMHLVYLPLLLINVVKQASRQGDT